MDYKNIFFRIVFSLILISIYLSVALANFKNVYYLIIVIYILLIVEIFFYFKKNKLIPIIYILVSFCFFSLIDFDFENFLIFNIYILSVIVFDSFSYIIGKAYGKVKLVNISPNKTLEGFIGGFCASITFSIVCVYLLFNNINLSFIIFLIFIIFSSFIGDIIESYFKRINNLKNSSDLIPGHGGIFDRFDSFLFSIIFYSISINTFL